MRTPIKRPGKGYSAPLGLACLVVACALSGVLLLAACGGGEEEEAAAPSRPAAAETVEQEEPEAPAGEKIEACSLITKAEAEEVLGEAVGEPVSDSSEDESGIRISICDYPAAAETSMKSVTLFLHQSPAEEAKARFEELKTQLAPFEEVSGLGDDAFWSTAPPQLHILKDGIYLIVGTHFTDEPGALEEAKAAAQIAVGRLP